MKAGIFRREIAGRELVIETGRLASQANGSVIVRYGNTVVLATAVMSNKIRDGVNFFPLMVDYEERLYAAGKIKGSRFMKREGRPTDEAVLSGRMVDRIIRPLFNSRIRNDIQVVLTVLSVDQENDPDLCSVIGASSALAISDIPWNGPVGVVRLAKVEGKTIVNPTYEQREKSIFDVVISSKGNDKINMIEAVCKEADENEILEAVSFSQSCIKNVIDFQNEVVLQVGKEKKTEIDLVGANNTVEDEIRNFLSGKLQNLLFEANKAKRDRLRSDLEEKLDEFIKQKFNEDFGDLGSFLIEKELNVLLKKNVLENNRRPDGRKMDEIRKIDVQVGLLPRTHGSGLFSRGLTQALTVATLGAPGDEQTLDGMEEVGTKRFMHHYTFPAFCVGETAPMRGPGRREIGHGALVEKALEALIPDKESFPYTIRLVSEILSSNGSSSMASVCGSSLALMDAGVPIPRSVAGIAMGLVLRNSNEYRILTDIQGPEDHYGDMDFKIAGTKNGITAMQMDVKTNGVSIKIIKETFCQANKARMQIIRAMDDTISEPRKDLSPYAPRITTLKINPEKIRDVIGPGGKVINEIIADTGVAIDIEDDGLIMITSKNSEAAKKAAIWIKNITREVVPGEIFQGKVTRIMNFGAFVEILPGQEGLIRISELSRTHVNKIEDIIKVGDIIAVKVKNIDDQGRINLTYKGV